jgi:hypothetical protein
MFAFFTWANGEFRVTNPMKSEMSNATKSFYTNGSFGHWAGIRSCQIWRKPSR